MFRKIAAFIHQVNSDVILPIIGEIRHTGRFENILLIFAAGFAGFVSVFYAVTYNWCYSLFLKLHSANVHIFWFLTPALFLTSWWAVQRWGPFASGSGIPQVMAAVELSSEDTENKFISQLLSLKTTVIKILSSLLCVFGGGSIGREGPTLQISASVYYFFVRKFHITKTKEMQSIWISIGAASGLAAAFNTPLGGVVYAIEEFNSILFQSMKTKLIASVIFSGLVAQWVLGSYLYLGYPQIEKYGFTFLFHIIVVGIFSGIVGGTFGFLLQKGVLTLQKFSKTKKIIWVIVCGAIVSAFYTDNILFSGSGGTIISEFLFKNLPGSWELLGGRLITSVFSYLSGVAGGIFAPSLAIGASSGALYGTLFTPEHIHLVTVLGMAGSLAGLTRTPFTAFILILEMTDHHSTIFPLMIAAFIGHWSAKLVQREGFYEQMAKRFLQQAQAKQILPSDKN